MRILFFMRSTIYVRNFESTLRLLADRGHEVEIVADAHLHRDSEQLIDLLTSTYPGITHKEAPPLSPDGWALLGIELRRGLDYLRYLGPEYRDAPKLRRRAAKSAPSLVTRLLQRSRVNTPLGRRLLAAVLRVCDRAMPPHLHAEAFIRSRQPDVVLVTPLVEPGSPQSAWLRAARALGIPTGLCVYSWDNLTNKGLIHDPLDLVTVWNEPMKREAVELHDVPAERVVVTGAAAYDHWFGWQPRADRESFCARVGLDPAQPYILYLASSRFIAPDEPRFVRHWIESIRSRSTLLRNTGVLVRPHPQHRAPWAKTDPADLGNVATWPPAGANPTDDVSRADYYDSIYHSAGVVGINTSAQIESAIVGRPVHTWLAPEFRDTQEGTLHFRHLTEGEGGLLRLASTIDEHVAQLEEAVRHPDTGAAQRRRFVERFVRPYGISEAAAPRLVAALEDTAARRVQVDRRPVWGGAVRALLRRAAADLQAAEEEGTREAVRRRLKRSPRPERIRDVSEVDVLRQYRRVHAAVSRWPHRAATADPPTPSEQRLLEALTPLWNGDPETVRSLRRLGEAITHVRPASYSGTDDAVPERLRRDLRRLMKAYPILRIDEPPVLGAFGVRRDRRLYNEDSLRFFGALTLMQDAALLNDFRRGPRRTVWEIGGGWGGFAYQFKAVCRNVTYLITGPPELLLLSGTYLGAVCSTATLRFYDPADPEAFWSDWDHVDFAFAPECVVGAMQPPGLALTVDLMALERMTALRIEQHIARAHALGAGHVFSICPAASADVDAGADVASAVDRWYWRHPVSAGPFVRWRIGRQSIDGESFERLFLLGWRRLRV